MLLEDKKLLITGVLTDDSIAWHVARVAQEQGAEIVCTGFGRGMRLTERSVQRLSTPADVLELDINDPAQVDALVGDLERRWGRLDGALHAIAFAPEDALGGNFLNTPVESASDPRDWPPRSTQLQCVVLRSVRRQADVRAGASALLSSDARAGCRGRSRRRILARSSGRGSRHSACCRTR